MADEPRIPTQDELQREGWDSPAADHLNDELTSCAHALCDCRAQVAALRDALLHVMQDLGADEEDAQRQEGVRVEAMKCLDRSRDAAAAFVASVEAPLRAQLDELTKAGKGLASWVRVDAANRGPRSGIHNVLAAWDAAVKPEQP